jgi:hypothetical protein
MPIASAARPGCRRWVQPPTDYSVLAEPVPAPHGDAQRSPATFPITKPSLAQRVTNPIAESRPAPLTAPTCQGPV